MSYENPVFYLKSFPQNFYPLSLSKLKTIQVKKLSVKLKVDGKEIPLNEFAEKILAGTIKGAVTSLKGIKEDWKKIELEIQK